MIVTIPRTVAEFPHEARGRVADVEGHGFGRRLARGPGGGPEGPVDRVGLGRERQIRGRLGDGEIALRAAEKVVRVPRRDGDGERVGVREADVLHGHAHEAARHVHRVLSAVQHARQPVQGSVRVRAAHRFVQGGDKVEVLLARLVVAGEPLLQRRRHVLDRDRRGAIRAGEVRRGLERIERPPGVAIRLRAKPGEGVRPDGESVRSEPSRLVAERAGTDLAELVGRQRVEHEHAGAGEERPHDLEARVLRRRADERDRAAFHMREEGVLLRPVEAVDLVHEEDGAAAGGGAARLGLLEDRADAGDALGYGRKGDERGRHAAGEEAGQGRLPGPGRPPEDEAGDATALDELAQGPARSDEF